MNDDLTRVEHQYHLRSLKLTDRSKIKVQEARIAGLKVLAEQISRLTSLTIEAAANEENHLYGSIGPAEVSKTLKGKNLMVESVSGKN